MTMRSTAQSRAGFMHIVAVSGMHVSFLVGLLQFILGRGKKERCYLHRTGVAFCAGDRCKPIGSEGGLHAVDAADGAGTAP